MAMAMKMAMAMVMAMVMAMEEVDYREDMEPNFWKEIYGEDYILGH